MSRLLWLVVALAWTSALSTPAAFAQSAGTCATIDFESIPGSTPSDDLLIDTQFESSLYLTFALEDGTVPRLAEVGSPTSAFEPSDTPAPGQGIGTYFLTDDGLLTSAEEPSPLIVTFTVLADSASGVVLDIDGGETFTIQARDANGSLLEEIVISAGDPNTGDGVATPWGFARPSADVASIRFMGVRPSGRFGLGFDLFTTCAPGRVPPPQVCTTLDFESIPSSVPVEGLVIDTQYQSTLGLTFALADGTAPRLAEVGSPTTAFEPNDTPDAGQGTGSFFLTDDGILSSTAKPPPLIVTFSTPADSASGVVLDIDFNETFTIQALDVNGGVLEEIVISAGDPNTGNGVATPWAFRRAQADVAEIRFEGLRPSGRFGLGFDLFTTCAPGRVSAADPGATSHDPFNVRVGPNPFHQRVSIVYDLAATTSVRLEIFSILGRRIATLVDGTQPSGTQRVSWAPEGTPSGAYLYRLQTADGVATGRFSRIR